MLTDLIHLVQPSLHWSPKVKCARRHFRPHIVVHFLWQAFSRKKKLIKVSHSLVSYGYPYSCGDDLKLKLLPPPTPHRPPVLDRECFRLWLWTCWLTKLNFSHQHLQFTLMSLVLLCAASSTTARACEFDFVKSVQEEANTFGGKARIWTYYIKPN